MPLQETGRIHYIPDERSVPADRARAPEAGDAVAPDCPLEHSELIAIYADLTGGAIVPDADDAEGPDDYVWQLPPAEPAAIAGDPAPASDASEPAIAAGEPGEEPQLPDAALMLHLCFLCETAEEQEELRARLIVAAGKEPADPAAGERSRRPRRRAARSGGRFTPIGRPAQSIDELRRLANMIGDRTDLEVLAETDARLAQVWKRKEVLRVRAHRRGLTPDEALELQQLTRTIGGASLAQLVGRSSPLLEKAIKARQALRERTRRVPSRVD